MINRTIVFLLFAFATGDCLKILGIFPYTGKSHIYVIDPLLTALAGKGHEVTVISHFEPKLKIKNRKDVVLESKIYQSEELINLGDFEAIPGFLSMIQVAVESDFLYANGIDNCETMLTNEGVLELVKSGAKFDVALVEQFNSDCLLGIVHKIGSPAIGITSDTFMPWHHERYGVTSNPSFIPCHNLGYGTKPSLWQAVSTWAVCGCMKLGYFFMSTLPTQDLLAKHLGDDIPPLDVLSKRIGAVMTNSYFALHGAFPLGPNVIEVGGLHLKNFSRLPEDLQTYMDESVNGVILLSFGSMIKAKTMSSQKLQAFLDAFSELPQNVLFKWENETMPNKPSNVMISKWLPQYDILNHKNTKAFITHAGMLSTTEAVSCGIPTVSIPLYGDQFANAAAAEESGLGITVHFKDITKTTLLNALKKVLDPKFQQSTKKLSEAWKDRPMPPLETAVYWVEHVARHGGQHLRPVSADLPLYRYLLLDVIAFLFIAGFLAAFVAYFCSSYAYRALFKSTKTKTKLN